MMRSTKIVATLGPASSEAAVLERMFVAGVDVVRLNFSHGSAEDHFKRAELVREVCRKVDRAVGIMADLQGPKIRVGRFHEGKIHLKTGDPFILDAGATMGDQGRVGLDYKELPRDVKAGDVLLLDDGRLVLDVMSVAGDRIHTVTRHGGTLSNNKGINRQGGGLTAPALTPKDIDDIRHAAKMQVDYVAVSFPKSGADMYMARELLRAAGGHAMLIAKIERAEAIPALADIMQACDGIMVARGDLAVEVGDAAVRMSSMSFGVSAGAVRPPPWRLMPLLFDSHPPWRVTVWISAPRTLFTSSTRRPSSSSSTSPDFTSRGSSL